MAEQHPGQDSSQYPPTPPQDPCAEPKPPEKPPEKPSPEKPPAEKPCPPPKTCNPVPPPRPPDPCIDPPKRPSTAPPSGPPASGGAAPPPEAGGTPPKTPPTGPAAHLEELKKRLQQEQKELQKLEPLKTSVTDLGTRIQALEKLVEGQAGAATSFKEFYRATEVVKSEIECFIPTVRCQLELTDTQKKCIREAIAEVDKRVQNAKDEAQMAKGSLDAVEMNYRRAVADLAWTKQWYDFLKTGLVAQVTKSRDDLKALKALADPKKDQCEAWFYLYELERLIKSSYDATDGCWNLDIWVGTFLDCWSFGCYEEAWNRIVVAFNDAEAREKTLKAELDQARKFADETDKAAKDAKKNRRDWILKEIKAKDCCGPLSRCP